MKPESSAATLIQESRAERWFAILFGTFLGLAIVKFGNPVILDQKLIPPASLGDVWADPWPSHWGVWLLGLLAVLGAGLALAKGLRWPGKKIFWALPLGWFGWQLVSATQSVDRELTQTTLFHFAGCLACYFLGATVLGNERRLRWLLAGLLVAFAFCLVRAVNQRLFEFPQTREFLLEGERTGTTRPEGVQSVRRQETTQTLENSSASMAYDRFRAS